jgi:hypothetical protein
MKSSTLIPAQANECMVKNQKRGGDEIHDEPASHFRYLAFHLCVEEGMLVDCVEVFNRGGTVK